MWREEGRTGNVGSAGLRATVVSGPERSLIKPSNLRLLKAVVARWDTQHSPTVTSTLSGMGVLEGVCTLREKWGGRRGGARACAPREGVIVTKWITQCVCREAGVSKGIKMGKELNGKTEEGNRWKGRGGGSSGMAEDGDVELNGRGW